MISIILLLIISWLLPNFSWEVKGLSDCSDLLYIFSNKSRFLLLFPSKKFEKGIIFFVLYIFIVEDNNLGSSSRIYKLNNFVFKKNKEDLLMS